ncbi:MAG: hypothetical protein P8Y36_13660 [Alphaproteobacteria bacterium]
MPPRFLNRSPGRYRPRCFGLFAPRTAPGRTIRARKTKSRHPPRCAGALFRSDGHVAVKRAEAGHSSSLTLAARGSV